MLLDDLTGLLGRQSPPRGPRRVEGLARALRDRIADGRLAPGDRLPPIRELASRLRVHPRVVSGAYSLLRQEGLATGSTGAGTRVADPRLRAPAERAAQLGGIADDFVRTALARGFAPEEIEAAATAAASRLRSDQMLYANARTVSRTLRLAGSHDLSIEVLAANLGAGRHPMRLAPDFCGSLAGLLRLAAGQADLAAVHLLDPPTGGYNAPAVARVLGPGSARLLLVAERVQGLLLPASNPFGLRSIDDLARPGVRLANRQEGSGTRTLLDVLLSRAGISPSAIAGYRHELPTHIAVAQAVARGAADVGLGIEAAARAHGLAFVPLAREPYELTYQPDRIGPRLLARLRDVLASNAFRQAVALLGGYDTRHSGDVREA